MGGIVPKPAVNQSFASAGLSTIAPEIAVRDATTGKLKFIPFADLLTYFGAQIPKTQPSGANEPWSDNGTLKLTTAVDPGAPPAAINDYWYFGSTMLKSGDVPIAASGDVLTKWNGNNALLTPSGMVAQSVGGLLTAKNNDSGYFELPSGYSKNRTDLTVLLHMQRPDCFQTKAYFKLGTGDGTHLNASNYGTIENLIGNGLVNRIFSSTGRASTFTFSVRSNGSGIKVGINGIETQQAAFSSQTLTGGRLLAFDQSGIFSSDRIWAAAIGPYLSDSDFAQAIAWCQSIRPVPSETSPTYNMVFYTDSQGVGLNSGGHSWVMDIADNFDARIIPVMGAATYFRSGGSPQNRSENTAIVRASYKPSAGRNVVVIATTNDLDQGSGAGAAYFASAKTLGLTLQGDGWEVWLTKQPQRNAPYGSAAAFNAQVDAYNALLVSDNWMDGVIDHSMLGNYVNSDGYHVNSTGQTIGFNQAVADLGLT